MAVSTDAVPSLPTVAFNLKNHYFGALGRWIDRIYLPAALLNALEQLRRGLDLFDGRALEFPKLRVELFPVELEHGFSENERAQIVVLAQSELLQQVVKHKRFFLAQTACFAVACRQLQIG